MSRLFKREFFIPVVIFLVPFLLSFFTRSISIDDVDSPHFLLGIDDFDISKIQPHAPGFPVYIFLGKIAHFFIKDNLAALTSLSALFGALSVLVFYFLIKKIFNKKIAIYSAIILAVTPMFWVNSIVVMTDMVAFFFLILSTYFIFSFVKDGRARDLYIGSFIGGITLGVRLHYAFVLIPFLIFAFVRRKNIKRTLSAVGLFFVSILSWFIPLILTQGFDVFFKRSFSILAWTLKSENVLPLEGENTMFGVFWDKIQDTFYYFFISGYGIDIKNFIIFFIFAFVVIFLVFLFKYNLKNDTARFLACGIIPYVLMLFITLPASCPRYYLPMIPILSVIIILGIVRLHKIEKILFCIFVFLILIKTLPIVVSIHSRLAPSGMVINFIESNYDSAETVLLFNFPMNSFYKYSFGNKFELLKVGGGDLTKISKFNKENANKKILFVSYDIPKSGYDLVATFKRNINIYPGMNTLYLLNYSNATN